MHNVEERSPKPKVLLVEDDDDSRALLAELLEDEFEVTTAPDGPSGLALFDRDPADILVTDESLPGMRGTALAREVKRRRPQARVVLVSGFARIPEAEACDRILRKPLDVEALSRALGDLSSSAR